MGDGGRGEGRGGRRGGEEGRGRREVEEGKEREEGRILMVGARIHVKER